MDRHHSAPPIRGLVFDLDGTLVDTLDEITAALNEALGEEGVAVRSRAQVRAWVGDGTTRLVERAWPEGSPRARSRVAQAVLERFALLGGRSSRPYPGVMEGLLELHGAGLGLAVLSNKDHPAAVRQVRASFSGVAFVEVRGVVDEARRKPHASGLRALVGALDLRPVEVAMVGDTATDIETARAAGTRSIAVTWGFRDRDELARAGPDHLVDSMGDLRALVLPGGANRTAAGAYSQRD